MKSAFHVSYKFPYEIIPKGEGSQADKEEGMEETEGELTCGN